LTSTDDMVTIENPATGLVVYNTLATGSGTTAVVEGLYIYNGSIWVLVDDVIGNEVTGATSGGGLEIAGSGITGDPYTLGIEDSGVTTAKIADKAVTAAKLDAMSATIGQVLMYDGSTWRPATLNPSAACSGAVVFDGAYDGPVEGTMVAGLGGNFDADWTNAAFSKAGRNLCWSKNFVLRNGDWSTAQATCAALNEDGAKWRLPHLIEAHVTYVACGGTGVNMLLPVWSDMTGARNGIDNGAASWIVDEMWCAEYNEGNIPYVFRMDKGHRGAKVKTLTDCNTRCVRTL
jgi:hypothetical protein